VNEKPRDDLTVIKGIGPIWQKRLQESLGVYTFQDLAALSSDEIISGLKPAPSKSECEAWISQAQELIVAAKLSTETEEGSQQTNSPVGSAEWKPIASFVVEFLSRIIEGDTEQRHTKVQHIETDTNASWPGIENVALCRWMLEQMGETALPELNQKIEEIRIRTLQELEQELDVQRAAAQQELQVTLEEERSRVGKEIEQERSRARQALEQELDEKRSQIQLELDQLLEKEQTRARQALQKELDEERVQMRKEIEQERTKARQALIRELDEEQRTQEPEDLEQELVDDELQSQPEMEKEFHPTAQISETRPVNEPHDALAITQLRAFQPGDAVEPVGKGIPGRPFSGFINGDELFTFVVDFELAEPAMSEITQQEMTYQAQFYVRDLLTGAKEHLGNTKANPLIEGRSSYIARLTDVTLGRGIYELTVLVTVQNREPRANYLMVPLLQIV